MKAECPQCGAEQVVMESDFFLKCPYCDASILVDTPAGTPVIVNASVSEESVRRLFPPGMVMSLEKRYFPYVEDSGASPPGLVPCFNQPWQELESYRPPAGDRKVFDETMAEPGEIIPIDRELADAIGGRPVLHPFFVVMLRLEGYGEGMLVDAVSGKILGEPPPDTRENETGTELERLFVTALLAGLVLSVPLYLLGRSLDLTWLQRIWPGISLVLAAAIIYFLQKRTGH